MTTHTHEQAHAEHMKKVRAVQRRSAYERVLRKIASYEVLKDLADWKVGDLEHLRKLRDELRRELVEHGQITPEEGAA